jgi:hypothetical protein
MKNEDNNEITIQDWLSFLSSQKELLTSIEQTTISSLISFGALFIGSLISLFQIYPYNVLGVIGLIISSIYIIQLLKSNGEYGETMKKINKIQYEILEGNLREVKEIVEKYRSYFPHENY